MYISISEVHLKGRGEGKNDEETNNQLSFVKTHFISKDLERYEVPMPT